MPRTPRRLAALLLAGATIASLAACAPADTEPTPPTPVESAADAPIFASDEEALAAAETAYRNYSDASTAVGLDGGDDTARIEPFVSPALFDQVAGEFAALENAGLRVEGQPRISGARLASSRTVNAGAEVSAYFCRDVSETRVIDAGGTDVTPVDRVAVQPVLAHFVSSSEDPRMLLVDQIERWSDDSFC